VPLPAPPDDDILDVADSLMEELATLHAAYRAAICRLRTPSGMAQTSRSQPPSAERTIVSVLDQFAADMPPVFRRLGELYGARSPISSRCSTGVIAR
jgi:hypothetical protein